LTLPPVAQSRILARRVCFWIFIRSSHILLGSSSIRGLLAGFSLAFSLLDPFPSPVAVFLTFLPNERLGWVLFGHMILDFFFSFFFRFGPSKTLFRLNVPPMKPLSWFFSFLSAFSWIPQPCCCKAPPIPLTSASLSFPEVRSFGGPSVPLLRIAF